LERLFKEKKMLLSLLLSTAFAGVAPTATPLKALPKIDPVTICKMPTEKLVGDRLKKILEVKKKANCK
jgi:hypothetical protein